MKTVGVIVGRFQSPLLTKGHRFLIGEVMRRHGDVLIVIGSTRSLASPHDPLDYETRAAMIGRAYPKARIANLTDYRFDDVWSKKLDALIARMFPKHSAILYGSRKSCLAQYHGKHETLELKSPHPNVSATDLRNSKKGLPIHSKDFRLGTIYAARKRRAVSYQTVDIAILDFQKNMVLLGARNEEKGLLRFVGGFVDPKDENLESAARREAYEETNGLGIAGLSYMGSFRIDDWRYRASEDGIMTAFFGARYVFGAPRPGDDIDRLEWVPWNAFIERLVPEHKPLGKKLRYYLGIAEERNQP